MAMETRKGSTEVELGDLLVDGVSLLLSARRTQGNSSAARSRKPIARRSELR